MHDLHAWKKDKKGPKWPSQWRHSPVDDWMYFSTSRNKQSVDRSRAVILTRPRLFFPPELYPITVFTWCECVLIHIQQACFAERLLSHVYRLLFAHWRSVYQFGNANQTHYHWIKIQVIKCSWCHIVFYFRRREVKIFDVNSCRK